MPKRFCGCQGCPACASPDRKPGNHGKLFNLDLTGTLKCPPCQAIATQKRNARAPRAQRGYDARHVQVREQLLAAFRPGDPCAICSKPMMRRWKIVNGRQVSAVDLAHTEDRTGYKGLSHRECNRATSKR